MSTDMIKAKPSYLLAQTFEQAMQYAQMIADSNLCPDSFKKKPSDVLIAIQMGAEVGLSPMQAVQNISVIKGRPCLWGDALLGVVRAHPHCKAVREWMDGDINDETAIAYCGITRRGQSEEIRCFSVSDAKQAGLWNKEGCWKQYKKRMLQMRARGFCARDVFPDALRGLHIAEEVQDIIEIHPPQNTVTVDNRTVNQKETPLSLQHTVDEVELLKHLDFICAAKTVDELKDVFNNAKTFANGDKIARNKIFVTKNKRKSELDAIPKTLNTTETERSEWLEEFNSTEAK